MAQPKRKKKRRGTKKPTIKGAQLLIGNWNVFKRNLAGVETSIGKAYVESLVRGNSPQGTTEHWALTSTTFLVGESLVVKYIDTRVGRTELAAFQTFAAGKTYIEATCVPRSVVDIV